MNRRLFVRLLFLALGDRLLTQLELKTERRIQQTCEELIDKERRRLEDEYRQRCDELNRMWRKKFDEEKEKLEKVRFDQKFPTKSN